LAGETSTICFRVQVPERELLEAVAHFHDQNLSEYVRDVLLDDADRVLKKNGVDAVIKKDREYEEQRLEAASQRLQSRHEGLSDRQAKISRGRRPSSRKS
jgi:uncharacterized protein (DUF1778 family)